MPIIKSAVKRAKQEKTRRARNVAVKTAIRTEVKVFHKNLTDSKTASEKLVLAISEMDRAVKKGVIHKNTAARKKSRLMRELNKAAGKPVKLTAKVKQKAESAPAKTKAKKKTAPTKKSPAKKTAK